VERAAKVLSRALYYRAGKSVRYKSRAEMLLPSFTAPKFRAFVGEEYGLTNTFTVGDALTSKYFEKPVELSFGSTARFLISNIKSFVPNLLRVDVLWSLWEVSNGMVFLVATN
jgi:hypothetical protein